MNGIPVIANSYPGLMAVIDGNQVGVCVGEVDAESMGAAIQKIVEGRLWNNITAELKNRYSWEGQEARYLGVFGH
jgi:glycosyltransferase involved in cell wall biosynthesis